MHRTHWFRHGRVPSQLVQLQLLGWLLLAGAAEELYDDVHQHQRSADVPLEVDDPYYRDHTVLDPHKFLKWDTQPEAGKSVFGNLTVWLDPYDIGSPVLQLRIMMHLSVLQPAPLGPLMVHCGGPGSDIEGCTDLAGRVYEQTGGRFDVWIMNQRGVGEDAHPKLICDKGLSIPMNKTQPWVPLDFLGECDCVMSLAFINPTDQQSVRELVDTSKTLGEQCYKSKRFRMTGRNGRRYNFLEYVGTQYLAYDMNLFRKQIGARKISIWGVSYGTEVAATFVSVFPRHISRLILDGNVMPVPTKRGLAEGCAEGIQSGISKLLFNCAFRLHVQGAACRMGEHGVAAYERIITQAASKEGITAPMRNGHPFRLEVGMIAGVLRAYLMDTSGLRWGVTSEMLKKLAWGVAKESHPSDAQSKRLGPVPNDLNIADESPAAIVAELLDALCTVEDVPVWYEYGVCPGFTTDISQPAVYGSDLSGRLVTSDVMRHWQLANFTYSPVGTWAYLQIMASLAQWPVTPTPVAPMGNVDVEALVIGNLYDPATRYEWSQQMFQSFPRGSMMTWQGIGHGLLGSAENGMKGASACEERAVYYLNTGILPPNGFSCRIEELVPAFLQEDADWVLPEEPERKIHPGVFTELFAD